MHKINVDALHEKWMDRAAESAWRFLGRKNPQKFAVFSPNEEVDCGDPMEYSILGHIDLPPKTDSFLMHMARHTLSVPSMSDECVKVMGLKRTPVPIFCLSSLLEASTPKSVTTQFFRGTIGCMYLGGLESQYEIAMEVSSLLDNNNDGMGIPPDLSNDPDLEPDMKAEIENHSAFYGLGVIMMRATREMKDPLASNEQLIKEMLNHYIGKV